MRTALARQGFLWAALCAGALALLLSLASTRLLHAGSAEASAPSAMEMFVRGYGAEFGLSLDGDGDVYYRKSGVEKPVGDPRPLRGAALERLRLLSERIEGRFPDRALVPVLQALLRPAIGDGLSLNGEPLYEEKGGSLVLSAFGRNVLMDLLTAEDGTGFQGLTPVQRPADGAKVRSVLDRLRKEGQLLHLAERAARAGDAPGREVFDSGGAALPQVVYPMGRYGKWKDLEKGRVKGIYEDPETGNMRLIVAAKSAVSADRYKVLEGEEEGIYEETGLDRKLIAGHGGRVVRAIDNLVEVDVSKEEASRLGRALEKLGINSVPNLKVALNAAGSEFSKRRFPLGRLLPIPRKVFSRLTGKFRTQSHVAKDVLKAPALWEKGMEGEGTVVAVIDTGLDTKHPDFQDRVLAYVDLVQGGADVIGHGTHVAGAVGGDGKASEGKYKGMAPKTKFVVIQVFNQFGMGASEYTLLAAMKIASSLPEHMRPDVVSMSLGINPPIGNNLHSSSLLSNYMMLRNNIFMSIAAGNSGPKKYTIGAPGNARHALTVTGTDKNGEVPYFPSRGPIVNWPFRDYNKPDIATIAGGVDRDNPCPYAPHGLIAAKSSDENFPRAGGDKCNAPDSDKYRYMSGTSMATPLASGIAADIIGYLKSKGVPFTASEVKALMMETADDLGRPAHEQGAGMVNGEKLARALEERAREGAAAGNIALMLSMQIPEFHRWYLAEYKGVVATEAGLLDTRTRHLVHSDQELDALRTTVDEELSGKPLWERMKIKLRFALRKGK